MANDESAPVPLRPCPFCGAEVKPPNPTDLDVCCYNCESNGPSALHGWHKSTAEAIAAWNTRQPPRPCHEHVWGYCPICGAACAAERARIMALLADPATVTAMARETYDRCNGTLRWNELGAHAQAHWTTAARAAIAAIRALIEGPRT